MRKAMVLMFFIVCTILFVVSGISENGRALQQAQQSLRRVEMALYESKTPND